jgi:Protein of unknown function (DUF3617)
MRLSLIFMAATILTLPACNKQPSQNGDSEMISRAPGSWKNAITLSEFTVKGAPPEARQMMQGMMQQAAATEVCITPEYAAKVNVADQLAQGPGARNCTYQTKELSGGKINVVAVCKGNDGKEVNLVMSGTVSPKRTTAQVSVSDVTSGGKDMNMTMQVTSEWTGECKPGQPSLPVPSGAAVAN